MKKEILQEDVSETPVPTADTDKVTVLSQGDSFVSGLVSDQGSFEQMEALYVKEHGQINLLELPEECKEIQAKTHRFKWMAKDKNLPARLRVGPWILCTRSNAPFIKSHRFGNHGAVEQAGMLLAFTTERLAKIREQLPAEKSAALVKHYTEELPSDESRGFYKPKSTGDDEDVVKEGELVEGRDF